MKDFLKKINIKLKNFRMPTITSKGFLLIGIYIIIGQNYFILKSLKNDVKKVEVQNPVSVYGSVGVNNRVDVTGSVWVNGQVNVENTVDMNLYSINGYRNFFNNPRKGDNDEFYTIPVINFGY